MITPRYNQNSNILFFEKIKENLYKIKKTGIKVIRQENDLPVSILKWGWKYHHLGIPTQIKLQGERYLPHLKFYVSGFGTSPFGIEWMRFDKDSPVNKLIQTVPHIAFEVEDLDYELANHDFKIITEPNSTSDGIRVAIIEHNGAPVELIEFKKK